jgi:hypothetical protein
MGQIKAFKNQNLENFVEIMEPFQSVIIPEVNEILGINWKICFKDWFTIQDLITVDVFLNADEISGLQFCKIQDLIDEKLSQGFQIVGRDKEYTGIKYVYILHYGMIDFRIPGLSFLPELFLDEMPVELLFAAMAD